MHRFKLAAVVLSLCAAGVAVPTIATAATAPATAIQDGTSNTIMLSDGSPHLNPGGNELAAVSLSFVAITYANNH
jgi:hypothetical protein